MPKQRKRTTLASRFRKRYGKKKRRSLQSKLLDSKINTAAEVAAKRIALEEIRKATDSLVFRQYLFGAYNISTNVWTLGTSIDWAGLITPIGQIQKMDNSSNPQIPPTANAYQTPSPWQDPGVNVVAMTKSMNGFRQATSIKVYGITFGIRAWTPKQAVDDVSPFQRATVHWRIVACNYEDMEDLVSVPLIEEVLPMKRFGYTSRLDTTETQPRRLRQRILGQGKLSVPLREGQTSVRFREKYYSLKDKQLTVVYADLDQNGQTCIQNKMFLCLRSDISEGAGFVDYNPLVNCFTKVHYVDT